MNDKPHWKECTKSDCHEPLARRRIKGPSFPCYPRADGKTGKGEYKYHSFPTEEHPLKLCWFHLRKYLGYFDLKYPLAKFEWENRRFLELQALHKET